MSDQHAVLFVCLGNICRSPLAEAAFRQAAARLEIGIEVDSAGTGDWHTGEAPDRRAQVVAAAHGIDISTYRARRITPQDFDRFSNIIALDPESLAALERERPERARAELSLLLDHVPGRRGQAVADPYYGTIQGFTLTWKDVTTGAQALLGKLSKAHDLV